MGVTQPQDDVTELSFRNTESEDVTVMSSRDREVVDEVDDDETRMSARATAGQEETADVTRLSQRSAAVPAKPATASGRKARRDLPPGSHATTAERGTFGLPPEEYYPREAPEAAPAEASRTTVAVPAPPTPALGVAASRNRREAARHRRLITAVIVVSVTAAVMTAALIGIVALVGKN
jgi:hypothetical protein